MSKMKYPKGMLTARVPMERVDLSNETLVEGTGTLRVFRCPCGKCKNIHVICEAVFNNDGKTFEHIGMPPESWREALKLLSKLIDN